MVDPLLTQSRLDGIMSFPVTPFGPDGELDTQRFREHIRYQLETPARAIFVACGTGEFPALDPHEHRAVVEIAVSEVGGEKPVFAGVGYATRIATQMTQTCLQAGADGVLVMPPPQLNLEQEALYLHYSAIAGVGSIAVIPYLRDHVRLAPKTAARLGKIPNVVAFKDAHGDVSALIELREATEGRVPIINGMPTAEVHVFDYLRVGVTSYSSAVLNFVPEVAAAYHRAFTARRFREVEELLAVFFTPFVRLRDQGVGYPISLVKAGVSMRTGSVGDVRLPLLPPAVEHRERLASLVESALASIGSVQAGESD